MLIHHQTRNIYIASVMMDFFIATHTKIYGQSR